MRGLVFYSLAIVEWNWFTFSHGWSSEVLLLLDNWWFSERWFEFVLVYRCIKNRRSKELDCFTRRCIWCSDFMCLNGRLLLKSASLHPVDRFINTLNLTHYNLTARVIWGLNRCVRAFFLWLNKFSFFRWNVSLLSVLSIGNASVKIKASVTVSWLSFCFFIFVCLRLESCIFVFILCCFNLLEIQLFLLLPNLFFLVELGDNITIAKLPKLLLSLLFGKSFAFFRNCRYIFEFLKLWIFLLFWFTFKSHSVHVEAHKMIVNFGLSTFPHSKDCFAVFFLHMHSFKNASWSSGYLLINFFFWQFTSLYQQQNIDQVILLNASSSLVIFAIFWILTVPATKHLPTLWQQFEVGMRDLKVIWDKSKGCQDASHLAEIKQLVLIFSLETLLVVLHV